eukprot:jgi/Antlo1/591/2336
MKKVCVIGAGNWGTTIAILIANNVKSEKVVLWCYEEDIDGRNLTEIINSDRLNPKYLPGTKIPENVFATADLNAVNECNVAVFALPHQFLKAVCKNFNLRKDVVALSLTKGFVDDECTLASEFISKHFGVNCNVLMGANIASEISRGILAESTLGCTDSSHCSVLKPLFHCDVFRIRTSSNVVGIEICGALKNVVAVAYGIVCGLECGENTRAAILRVGISEINAFLRLRNASTDVMFESCGMPDLIVTCIAGRNRKCGEKLSRREPIDSLLQGPGTAQCLHNYLKKRGVEGEFGLFSRVYRICFENEDPKCILSVFDYE